MSCLDAIFHDSVNALYLALGKGCLLRDVNTRHDLVWK